MKRKTLGRQLLKSRFPWAQLTPVETIASLVTTDNSGLLTNRLFNEQCDQSLPPFYPSFDRWD